MTGFSTRAELSLAGTGVSTAHRGMGVARIALAIAATLLGGAAQVEPPVAPDAAPWQSGFPARPATFTIVKHSLYLTMKDGVRLAADVYLPKDSARRVPTLFVQTRYYRKTSSKADPRGSCAANHALAQYFTARGYAMVILDVRGSGASFGSRPSEFSPGEIADGGAVLDWIVAQPWSNGRVGAFGQSYLGSIAELLTTTGRPALKAIAPVSAAFDFYADLFRPGGIPNTAFQPGWSALVSALDSGHPSDYPALSSAAAPCPVDADPDGTLMAQAIAEHRKNVDSARAAVGASFRDDAAFRDHFPFAYEHLAATNSVPVLSLEASHDSAYARTGINRFINGGRGQRLILAAGDHGAHNFYAPGTTAKTPSSFDQNAEILAFMDHYVDGVANGYEKQPRVRWFVTGANQWRSADVWPVAAHSAVYQLVANGMLSRSSTPSGRMRSINLPDAGDDQHGRWDTTLGAGAVFHADQSDLDRSRPIFTSAPLSDPIEIVGSPVASLRVSDTASDGDWFVYLEEVDPAGHAWRVTDGLLRTSARRGAAPYRTIAPLSSGLRRDRAAPMPGRDLTIRIALLPIAHRFAANSRLRLVVVGSDQAHFGGVTMPGRSVTIATGDRGSTLTLPIVPR